MKLANTNRAKTLGNVVTPKHQQPSVFSDVLRVSPAKNTSPSTDLLTILPPKENPPVVDVSIASGISEDALLEGQIPSVKMNLDCLPDVTESVSFKIPSCPSSKKKQEKDHTKEISVNLKHEVVTVVKKPSEDRFSVPVGKKRGRPASKSNSSGIEIQNSFSPVEEIPLAKNKQSKTKSL